MTLASDKAKKLKAMSNPKMYTFRAALAFLFLSLLLKYIFHCPMATVSHAVVYVRIGIFKSYCEGVLRKTSNIHTI